jgi:hypothetical protein
MSAVPRSLWLRALVLLGLVTLVASVVVGISLMKIASTSRAEVATESLAAIDPDKLGSAFEREWSEVLNQVSNGSYVHLWYSDRGESLMIEIWKRGNPVLAEWVFRSSNQKINYKSDFPGLVQNVALPKGLGADEAELFCGNVGRSRTAELEECQIWGYWARYGQYVVYLDIYATMMRATSFREAVLSFDHHVEVVLDGA